MNKINTNTASIEEQNSCRLAYTEPQSIEVGNATELVQGGGGRSGMDYLYYYYLDGNYE